MIPTDTAQMWAQCQPTRAIVAVSLRSNMAYLNSDPPVTLVPLERLGPLLDDLRLGKWLHHVCVPVVAQQQLLKGKYRCTGSVTQPRRLSGVTLMGALPSA